VQQVSCRAPLHGDSIERHQSSDSARVDDREYMGLEDARFRDERPAQDSFRTCLVFGIGEARAPGRRIVRQLGNDYIIMAWNSSCRA